MSKYYIMSKRTCFLCKDNNGMREDATPNKPLFEKCDHRISVGCMDLQINELEEQLKELKKAKRYAKMINQEE